VVRYRIVYAKQAQKDAKKIARSNLKEKALELIDLLQKDPFRKPPEYEALVGDLSRAYSRRLNIQHRLIYQVYEEEKVVKVLRMWTHYGD
jgi:Txe/YoeB family toxin of toxin-antitoxin system